MNNITGWTLADKPPKHGDMILVVKAHKDRETGMLWFSIKETWYNRMTKKYVGGNVVLWRNMPTIPKDDVLHKLPIHSKNFQP